MTKPKQTPLDRLKHHVTGAIERGEKTAIGAVVAPKHTPGHQWDVQWCGDGVNVEFNSGHIFDTTRESENSLQDIETLKANARLIAAAPELLDALIKLRDATTLTLVDATHEATRVILKATGGAE